MAIFGHFQNALIFRMLAAFGNRFLRVLGNFIFFTETEYFAN